MSRSNPATGSKAWLQIVGLGQELMFERDLGARRALIAEAGARLVSGEVEVWLAPLPRRLPDEGEETTSPSPSSDLMRRALDSGTISSGEGRIALPMHAQGESLGVMEVAREPDRPFSEGEIELLEGLAAQSAFALGAARQMAVQRWRLEQLSLVRQVSAQVASVLDLGELARRVTELIRSTFGYYYVALFTRDPGREVLEWRASAAPGRPASSQTQPFPAVEVRIGEGIIGHVAKTGMELLSNNVQQEPQYRHVDALPETRSEAALPMKIEDRVLGVLDVQSDELDGFDETDMAVLRALTNQIALAVEDARLYSDLRRRADQLSAVAEASRAVASILDLDRLLDKIVSLIHEQFGYPFVYLFTVDPARRQIVFRTGRARGEDVEGDATVRPVQGGALVCSLDAAEGIVPWVACHGETVVANDVTRDPRYRPPELPPADTRAELTVPLVFGGRVLGVLDVQSDRRNVFDEEDRFLFEALADSVAVAIRNANLYRSERWRRKVAESLREVAGLLSADLALEEVLDAILTELERTLPCDAAAIWLLRDDDLCLSAVHGLDGGICLSDSLPGAHPWLRQALQADQSLVRPAGSSSEPLGAALGFSDDYSAIAAPLRVGDRRLGLLTLVHRDPDRYGTESRAMTTAFANYAAVAIENARLYQEAQERALISTVMVQVAEATRLLTTLDEVLETVVHLMPTLVGVDRCAILLWDDSVGAFVPAVAFGLTNGQQQVFREWRVGPRDSLAFDDVRSDKAPVFIYDVATDPRLPGDVAWALGFESLLLLPLLAQDEVLGVMLVDYRGDWLGVGEALHDERLVIAQGIAHQTAAAVESTRLREERQEEAYVSAALLQVAKAVATQKDLDAILSTIVRIAPILVGVERCVIYLLEEEQGIFWPAQTYGVPGHHDPDQSSKRSLAEQRYAREDFPLLDLVCERDELTVHSLDPEVAAAEDAPLVPSDFIANFLPDSETGAYSLLAVPLSVKGNAFGAMVLELEETDASGRSRERRLEIIDGIAHQAALAVQNDWFQQEMAERERLERELQLARQIQQTFIPDDLPHLSGWELAATWRAARQVAGDFYDLFGLSDGRLGLVIADVADKGMAAALFMALTRTLMRATANEDVSPATTLARVNDLLVPDAQQGMFVTALYGILCLESGELIYANAGHNLPLLLRSDTGEVARLQKGGMALGVLEGSRSSEWSTQVEPGDFLVMYTDGVTEAFSPEGELFGEERLREVLRANLGKPAQGMLEAIEEAVVAFVGDTHLSDDLTLMVLRRQK